MRFPLFAKLVFAVAVIAGMVSIPAAFAVCCDGKSKSSPILTEKNMPGQIVIGKPYGYSIRVTNQSDCLMDDVSVIETLPETYDMSAATPEASRVTGRVAQWDFGALKPGEAKVIQINGSARGVGSFVSCTKVVHSHNICFGPQLGMPAILLEVVDTEDPVQVGGMEKFYVTVTNQGNAEDSNVAVSVSFEDNFDYVSAAGPTRAQSETAKAVEFAPLPVLGPGQKATWEVTAKSLSEGDHRTSVKLTSDSIQRSVDETEATRIY
ncbi:MAG: DUF11 domain-containing protein [Candidatus Omnitrophica bacterium]|nr:DUF11 domain-containing protein [Candidatus Omnitrophota bacterium]